MPGSRLNSLFHSVPVRGDYKLSKKNEILVDLFLNTLFHTVLPPPSNPIHSSNQVCSSFLPSLSPPHPNPHLFQPLGPPVLLELRGQVRGHLAGPRCRAPATKASAVGDLSPGSKLSPSPRHPPPPPPPSARPESSLVKKTPAGMLQWGQARRRGRQSLDAVTRRVTLGTHQPQKGGKEKEVTHLGGQRRSEEATRKPLRSSDGEQAEAFFLLLIASDFSFLATTGLFRLCK